MNKMDIVILPQDAQRPALRLGDTGSRPAWRPLRPDAKLSGDDPFVLIVPGIEVRAVWLHLPTRNMAQAVAAARLQLEDELALGADQLHLALGPLEEDGHRLAVAVSGERMQRWLEEGRRFGREPDVVIPDCLALPAPPDGAVLAVRTPGGAAIVRGPRLAFACEEEMLEALLQDRPAKDGDLEGAARLMADALAAPAINLRQGAFAPRRAEWWRDRRLLRVAALAALVLASPVLLRLGEAVRLDLAAGRLHAANEVAAASALGTATGGKPEIALARRLRQLELASGGGPAGHIAQLFSALENGGALQLEALQVGPEGVITASLRHASAADLEAFAATLRRAGLGLAVESSRPDGAGSISDVRLGGAP